MSVATAKLHKIPTERYLSKYGHPNGWTIVQDERDWDLRGFPRGAIGATLHTMPKRWWEVRRTYRSNRAAVETFPTLREARAWCDEHVAGLTP